MRPFRATACVRHRKAQSLIATLTFISVHRNLIGWVAVYVEKDQTDSCMFSTRSFRSQLLRQTCFSGRLTVVFPCVLIADDVEQC